MIKDKITLERIETAHPVLRQELRKIYKEICETVNSKYSQVRFAWVLRPNDVQDALFAQGRTKPGPRVTSARAGQSYHNYGLAVDIVLILDKDRNGTFETASWDTVFDGDGDFIPDWLEVSKIFIKYGWQWGLINSRGKRYDLPHFQKTLGLKTSQLAKLNNDSNGYPIIVTNNC